MCQTLPLFCLYTSFSSYNDKYSSIDWVDCVAQLVERLLQAPEVRSLNPVCGKLYITDLLSTVLKRRKKKEYRIGPILIYYALDCGKSLDQMPGIRTRDWWV